MQQIREARLQPLKVALQDAITLHTKATGVREALEAEVGRGHTHTGGTVTGQQAAATPLATRWWATHQAWWQGACMNSHSFRCAASHHPSNCAPSQTAVTQTNTQQEIHLQLLLVGMF